MLQQRFGLLALISIKLPLSVLLPIGICTGATPMFLWKISKCQAMYPHVPYSTMKVFLEGNAVNGCHNHISTTFLMSLNLTILKSNRFVEFLFHPQQMFQYTVLILRLDSDNIITDTCLKLSS